MANDLNSVNLIGRLTRDCEIKTSSNGTSICRFSIAVNRRIKSGDAYMNEVSYFDVLLLGKAAETLGPYLNKGRQISISGSLRQNRWEQDGQARSRVEIVANSVQLLGSIDNTGSQPQAAAKPSASSEIKAASAPTVQPQPDLDPEDFESDNDIPF